MKIDALWTNGRFWTGDPSHPEAHTIAVHAGSIVAMDDDAAQLNPVAKHDLGGARVIPGLHDAHNHLAHQGHRLLMVDLRGVRSLDALYDALAERAANLPIDAWIKGTGYDQNQLGGEHPTAEALDRAVGGRPCIVEHVSSHMVVVNTIAFELAGYPDRRYPDVPGGRVFRDPDGRATGLLQERAMDELRDFTSRPSINEAVEAIGLASDQAISYGLTSITEPGVIASGSLSRKWADIHVYQTASERGLLKPRMTLMPFHFSLHPIDALEGFRSLDLGIRTGFGDDRLRIGPVKIISDGSLIGRSAAVHECYCGEPENLGVMQLDPEELREAIIAFHRSGWAVATHAIGDRAIDYVLDAVEEAQKSEPLKVRHRIEHFAIASDAQVDRCAQLGIIPVPQGVFISDFGDGILESIGPDRSAGTYRMKSLMNAGMTVPGSTDSPVSDANPFACMHALVNRLTAEGQAFGPAEKITVEEAVRAYTHGSAYAVNREDAVGTLSVGKLADFVALDHDIFTVDPEGIRDLTATATVIGGELVYEGGRNA
ncbi:amidohydrolase [Pseudarthrobacter sp. J75]|uniref:amidohydrolase n=1 Tax=unclassified Pseudarthrobacter TaxID=2647000 RepID=UPI002E81BAEE|nr:MULTISPECIES: amidohydrolase [unclassified Pseudarthrobacter]MEE2522804.1 amidohydrolase [Pseudarthrobacter sp. J47]MEE2529665.1 amidohydrolase [Pseudarthrobacter sp. J75]